MTGLGNGLLAAFLSLSFGLLCFFVLLILLMYLFKDKIIATKRMKKVFEEVDQEKRIRKKDKLKYLGSKNIIKKTKFFEVMKDELVLSGIIMKPDEVIILWLIAIFVPSGVVAVISGNIIPPIVLIILGIVIPPWLIRKRKSKYLFQFELQLSDALDIMSNCLQSGLTLHQAIESISNEMGDPISREFKRVLREVQYGSNLDDALNRMTERIKSNDLMLMVSAILIQRQVGGNLSRLLNNISGTIKERVKLKEEIKVLTSTGRMSGTVVGILPIVILVALALINPGYIQSFFNDQRGIIMLVVAAIMELIGFAIVRRIVTIKF